MYLFASEAVSSGHPDKCADIIADSIVDTLLQKDATAKVATEVFLAARHIIIGGEVKSKMFLNHDFYKNIAKKALTDIGYPEAGFTPDETLDPNSCNIHVFVEKQSADITMGVSKPTNEIGAGDQGMMFGYATNERDDYMPTALMYAREIRDVLYLHAKDHPGEFGVDLKTQVIMDYGTKANFDAGKPEKIDTIVVAISHVSTLSQEEVAAQVKTLICENVHFKEGHFNVETTKFFINNTGRFVKHSPLADSGLSGRKVVCDTYGGYAPVGGGSQSSKDYSKVDRSGLYAARWIAKHLVAAGVCDKALVQLSFVIAEPRPISVTVDTLGTSKSHLADETLSQMVYDKFPLTPRWITDMFGLDKPSKSHFLYADVAARGQIGYTDYPWEILDQLTWFQTLR